MEFEKDMDFNDTLKAEMESITQSLGRLTSLI